MAYLHLLQVFGSWMIMIVGLILWLIMVGVLFLVTGAAFEDAEVKPALITWGICLPIIFFGFPAYWLLGQTLLG